ncbi:hypothetical protein MVEN_02614000 [Mycena venus]|uniref:Uncharacterized protein n=1 Tax=Mycena venus TaxID=2733690 RepID=A0A8H6U2W1_9AGAR|nr:hypothetical protein MVEN_02614000 [Mycena venus]
MSPISLVGVNLAVVVLESLFYGLYFVLALHALYLMVIRRRERRSTRASGFPGHIQSRSRSGFLSPGAIGAFSLFITVTSHWLLNVIRLFIAFHHWEDGVGPQRFYSNLSHITEVLKYGFLVASMLIGDSLIIHHLFVIWAFSTRMIIVPSITLTGFAVFGVGLTYQLSTFSSDDSFFKAAFRRWATGVCFFSMCTAAYSTGFIWYRLWNTSRTLRTMSIGSSLGTITRIFIDSAALITSVSFTLPTHNAENSPQAFPSLPSIWGLFHTVSYQRGSNIQFVAADCVPVVIGISNLLLQLRLHRDLTTATIPQQYQCTCREVPTRIRFTTSHAEVDAGQIELGEFASRETKLNPDLERVGI